MDKQQELFTALLVELKEHYDVYDGYLPPAGTEYPFVYLADSEQSDEANKEAVFGTITQTIHVWHDNPKKRGTVSAMMLKIKQICRDASNTSGWMLTGMNQTILADDTTGARLVHGIIIAEFRFS